MAFRHPAVHIQQHLPHKLSLAVVCLRRRTEVVMHYRVAFPVRDLRHRSERRSVIYPCHKALRLLRAVVFLASGLVRDEHRPPGFVGVPFVQYHVAVPPETVHGVIRPLGYSSAEGIIAERYRPAVGSPHPGKHTVGLPLVAGVALL
ncbi:hypothetical protein, partial [Bacteroides uniformis]